MNKLLLKRSVAAWFDSFVHKYFHSQCNTYFDQHCNIFFKALLSFLAWDQAPLWGENGKKWSEMAKKKKCELSVLSSRLEMKKGWLCLPIFWGAFFSTVEPGPRLYFFWL